MPKVIRMLSAESTWEPAQLEIDKGLIQPFHLPRLLNLESANVFTVLKMFAEGWWWKAGANGKMVLTPPTAGSFDGVVGYFIESLNTIGDLCMRDHIAKRRKISQEVVGDFGKGEMVEVEVEGKVEKVDRVHGQAAQSHYGQVQNFLLLDLVPLFAKLPVDFAIWTAHEAKGEDKETKATVFGPASVGSAAVAKTAQKFGNTFHLDWVTPGKRGAYYTSHPDPTIPSIKWPAKVSLPPSLIPKFEAKFKGGFIPLGLEKGIEQYFEFRKDCGLSKGVGQGNLFDAPRAVTCLLYGASDLGKTTAAGHMARWACEGGKGEK